MLKDRFEQVKDQIPEDKRKEMEKLKDLRFDSDSITINAPMVRLPITAFLLALQRILTNCLLTPRQKDWIKLNCARWFFNI